jgi:hypothetical protein
MIEATVSVATARGRHLFGTGRKRLLALDGGVHFPSAAPVS